MGEKENKVAQLVQMSKYAGERLDLIQAGGGNTSVKLSNGQMLIKASGFLLSDVEHGKGYVEVDNNAIVDIVNDPEFTTVTDKKQREQLANNKLKQAYIDSGFRPSIETFLHSLLYTYTLHTHPIAVNVVTCQATWKETVMKLVPEAVCVGYETPGIELALALKQQLDQYQASNGKLPEIVFLQNHGIIVSSDDFARIEELHETTMTTLEQYTGIDLTKYKRTSQISKLVHQAGADRSLISWLSCDLDLLERIGHQQWVSVSPFCPDGYVFCGFRIVTLADWSDVEAIRAYMAQYHEPPKVIVCEGHIFMIAANVRKAKEIEDVLKFHLLTVSSAHPNVSVLPEAELKYLANWDSEKYRQKL